VTKSEELARQKYRKALVLIESAQNRLAEACQELSPLIGAIDQWELVGKHYDLVHQLWRNVAYNIARDNVRMDSNSPEFDPSLEP
jgi:hypothetical protein